MIYIGVFGLLIGVVMFVLSFIGYSKAKRQHDYFLDTQKDFKEYQEFKEEMFK